MKKLALVAASAASLFAFSAPAHAAYLFGYSPTGTQTLVLGFGSLHFSIQANQTGWFDASGNHNGGNDNYLVTDSVGAFGAFQSYRDYFGFNISVPVPIDSAELRIGNNTGGQSSGPMTWTVYDVDGTISTATTYTGATGIWTDLGSGHSYGSATINAPTSLVTVALDSVAIAKINAANSGNNHAFFLGGVLSGQAAVPEASTWAMMLAGFGAIGFAMRRKPQQKVRLRFAI